MAFSDSSDNIAQPALQGEHTAGGFAIVGISNDGKGVEGRTIAGTAVVGIAGSGTGVVGVSDNFGVVGVSDGGKAVEGRTATGTALVGSASGVGGRAVVGVAPPGVGMAGHFEGDVEVSGDIKLLGADCAEEFEVSDPTAATPGTVMVLDDSGGVRVSDKAYDSRVAGVISGAGHYRPGLILDRQTACDNRRPVALMGKTYCKVDATSAAIAIGDLLTSSPTPGHAMKAMDPHRALGTVIGKALEPCVGVRGLIPILVVLR